MSDHSAATAPSPGKHWLKRVALALVLLLVVAGTAVGGYVFREVSAFDASLEIVYPVKPIPFARSSDPAVIARGKHLAESLGGCALGDCHGADLSGGRLMDAGPIGKIGGPNITPAGRAGQYSDAELGRVIRHGIKRDGRGVRMMPVPEFNWLPADDITAIISYVRSVPAVQKADPAFEVGVLGKILDRRGTFPMDVARRIDHGKLEADAVPAPSPTVEYGRFVGRLCMGCHGDSYSGGPIPGAPPEMPVPLNLTPHETGLKGWSFEDFEKAMKTGLRKDGRKMADFMPRDAINSMNAVEKQALWAFLQSLPAKSFGGR